MGEIFTDEIITKLWLFNKIILNISDVILSGVNFSDDESNILPFKH